MKDTKISKAASLLGKKAGTATFKKHGRKHYVAMGKKSGIVRAGRKIDK